MTALWSLMGILLSVGSGIVGIEGQVVRVMKEPSPIRLPLELPAFPSLSLQIQDPDRLLDRGA